MKKVNTILVTGSGGDIGTGVGRILKESRFAKIVIGVDAEIENAGNFIFDISDTLPNAGSSNYFRELKRLIKTYSVDLLIPLSESEIRLWHKNGFTQFFDGVPVVMPNIEVLDISFDKYKTINFLKGVGMPYPWTGLVSEGLPFELPCIIKSRGIGDKGGVELVESQALAKVFVNLRKENIWQEYLRGVEYTAGLFGCRNGDIRVIVMKRKLSGGMSGFTVGGEVEDDQKIILALTDIAKKLSLVGSVNLQFRITNRGPVVFEINPRFSSTVVFRHKLGFRDVCWAVQDKLGLPVDSYIPPIKGTKFYKGYTEFIAKP